MSSWSQWFVAYQKNPSVKQVTWLCGTEPVLVDETLEAIRSHFRGGPSFLSTFVVGDDSERDVWADLDQHPIDGKTPRLVVVKHAEKLKRLDRIVEWVNTRSTNPLTFVVFVADEPVLAREEQTREQKSARKQADLLPHLAAIQGKGSLIECRPFTQATAKHAVSWVQSKVDIRKGVAGKLLERANADLRLVRDSFRKLSVFPDEITEQTVNLLLSARPRMSFVDALLSLDKPAALLALTFMRPSEFSGAIGLLDQRIEIVGKVRDMLVQHNSPAQISAALGNQGFLTRDLIPIAKTYDPKRRHDLRLMLAKTDEALRQGVTEGPLEALVLFW